MSPARFALYWAPELDDPLHAAGSAWLGRDAETGSALRQPAIPGVDLFEITRDARLYGLHATLKAPFRLATSWEALHDATAALAARIAPFDLPPLAVTDLDGFLALTEQSPCPPLQALCDQAVAELDPHRAPLTEAEIARRRPERLTAEQRGNLLRWGYPYVFGAFFFHVTLTRRLTPEESALVRPAAEAAVGAAARHPRRVASVCLFSQPEPGQPFRIAERFALSG
jgi:putative phosphonate metabolism protein